MLGCLALGAAARFGRTAPAAPATATAAPSTAPELLEAVEAEAAAPRVAEEGATALVTGDTKLGASLGRSSKGRGGGLSGMI